MIRFSTSMCLLVKGLTIQVSNAQIGKGIVAITLALLALTTSGLANSADSSTHLVQPQSHYPPKSYETVGKTRLKVLWFDVYDAVLKTPNGRYVTGSPALLELSYLRDIKSKALVKETKKQLANALSDEVLERAASQLGELWPDVTSGDKISFLKLSDDKGVFYFNDNELGEVNMPNFAAAFLDIWLGEDSEYPKLAAQLKGEK